MSTIQNKEKVAPPICERCGNEMEYSEFLARIGKKGSETYSCNDKICNEARDKEQLQKREEEERNKRELYLRELPGKVEAEPWMYLNKIDIPPKYLDTSLDTFKGGANLIKASREYLKNPINNLLFTGNCGSGKTHIACAILRELVKQGKDYVRFKSVPDLLYDLRNSYRENPLQTEREIIQEYTTSRFIVLDDLGAEKTSEYSITSLYRILDKRVNKNYTTIITTNLSLKQIENNFGSRIASRLSEFRIWEFTMPDYRKKR